MSNYTNYAIVDSNNKEIRFINTFSICKQHVVNVSLDFGNYKNKCRVVEWRGIVINAGSTVVKVKYEKKLLGLIRSINITTVIDNINVTHNINNVIYDDKVQGDGNFKRKVIYLSYADIDWNNISNTVKQIVDVGFNVINLAFYIGSGYSPQPIPGPADAAYQWSLLTKDQQLDTIKYAEARGAKIMVSAGGATDTQPYNVNANIYATNVSNWCKDNNLHGVDYDLESIQNDFTFGNMTSSDMYNWFLSLYITTRTILGPEASISHAPQAPYLAQVGHNNSWPGTEGGYVKVFNDARNYDGIGINWLNIQFYNQGNFYTTYNDIFVSANPSGFPYSAMGELGLPLDSLVYGTYLQSQDGSGFHDPVVIHDYFIQANEQLQWSAGSMLWMWRSTGQPTAQQWITTVYNNP